MSDRPAAATEAVEPQATGLPPHEAARWLCPLLREYAGKLDDLLQRSVKAADQIIVGYYDRNDRMKAWTREAGLVVCLLETLDRRVSKLTGQASGLVEHAALDYETKTELALRLDEIEERLRFVPVMIEDLAKTLGEYRVLDETRKLIERSGRYKSPV
jgi:hypothetical protein